jgi:cytochrome c oxidase subunit I+III
MLGAKSHAVWGMWVLIAVLGMIWLSMVFSYFYLWSVQPDRWPPPGAGDPSALHTLGVLAFYAGSAMLLLIADRLLHGGPGWSFAAALGGVITLLAGALWMDLSFWLRAGVVPTESSYGASLFTFGLLNGVLAFALALMAAFLIARRLTGRLDAVRRLGFDVTWLFCGFALVQGVLTVALTHGFAWMVT